MITRSFLTGSRVYGTPHEDSDIDLVVLVKQRTLENILDMSDQVVSSNGGYANLPTTTATVRFGKLNLICVTDEEDFMVWWKGTQHLKAKAPVNPRRGLQVFC